MIETQVHKYDVIVMGHLSLKERLRGVSAQDALARIHTQTQTHTDTHRHAHTHTHRHAHTRSRFMTHDRLTARHITTA